MAPIRVAFERVGDRAALGVVWRELESRAEPSFFTSWTWIQSWIAETNVKPWIVTARQEGRVVGLGLLAQARRYRSFGFSSDRLLLQETGDPAMDLIYAEYNGLLAERGCEATVGAAVLEALVASEADLPPELRGWDELRLGGVGEEYLILARRTGLDVRVVEEQPSARVDLDAVRKAGGDYSATLSANTRQQIRRSVRLYEARGPVVIDAAGDVGQAFAFLDDLAALHQRTWQARGKCGAFASPFFDRFCRSLIRHGLPHGEVELLRVRAGETAIGYLYNFVRGSWVGNYTTGFAYESDSRLKPGLVCFHLAVERHLTSDATSFDFLAGGQRYKKSLGTPGPQLYWLDLRRPRLKFRVQDILRSARDGIRQRLC